MDHVIRCIISHPDPVIDNANRNIGKDKTKTPEAALKSLPPEKQNAFENLALASAELEEMVRAAIYSNLPIVPRTTTFSYWFGSFVLDLIRYEIFGDKFVCLFFFHEL